MPRRCLAPSPGSPLPGQATLSRSAGVGLGERSDRSRLRSLEVRACARERIAREQALDALIAAGRLRCTRPGSACSIRRCSPPPIPRPPRACCRGSSRVSAGCAIRPETARLARLRAALAQEPRRARTLGGCRFVPWRGRLLVLRELAAAEAPIALEPGADLLWDRRFAVSLSPRSGRRGSRSAISGSMPAPRREGGFGRILPPLVHSVLPAFWDEEGVAACRISVMPGPVRRFCRIFRSGRSGR